MDEDLGIRRRPRTVSLEDVWHRSLRSVAALVQQNDRVFSRRPLDRGSSASAGQICPCEHFPSTLLTVPSVGFAVIAVPAQSFYQPPFFTLTKSSHLPSAHWHPWRLVDPCWRVLLHVERELDWWDWEVLVEDSYAEPPSKI